MTSAPVPQANTPQRYTIEEWRREGERRFGPNQMKWRFICPVCGHVQTPADWKAARAPASAVAFSCVGRFTGAGQAQKGKPGPCNYAGGGLFKLNPVTVVDLPRDDGKGTDDVAFFAFADPLAFAVHYSVMRGTSDYPGEIVVRKWIIPAAGGQPEPGGIVVRAPDLGAARDALRSIDPNLYRLDRQPGDDPVIVETWI